MSARIFVWYELMSSDPEAAESFYAGVVGWKPERFAESPRYTLMKMGERGIAGIMPIPEDIRDHRTASAWFGYIGTDDIDGSVDALKTAGGQVSRQPFEVPTIGRVAVVSDPQGAMFMFIQPQVAQSPPSDPDPGTPGEVGWRELLAEDWKTAWDFYSSQFGWTKDMAVDMGPMGTYQTFAADGVRVGGMMTKHEPEAKPVWRFYFNVEAIDAAAERVKTAGGQIVMGPMEVPGGQWVANCADPQGAWFSLVAPKR